MGHAHLGCLHCPVLAALSHPVQSPSPSKLQPHMAKDALRSTG